MVDAQERHLGFCAVGYVCGVCMPQTKCSIMVCAGQVCNGMDDILLFLSVVDSPILSFLDEYFQFCVVILNHVMGNFHEGKANCEVIATVSSCSDMNVPLCLHP